MDERDRMRSSMPAIQTEPMTVRADHVRGCKQGRWTYESYAAIPDDGKRYEVVQGVLYVTPAPNLSHQAAVIRFATHLFLEIEQAGLGRVFPAPCDVELAPHTVVQPDIVVVLNASAAILTPSRIIGVPDLVVEIASPGTAGYDRRTKQDAYARAGVPEYWIADPAARTIEVLRLEGKAYTSAGVFAGESTLPAGVLPALPVQAGQLFS
jgi:Uma2 family endonuclease